MSDFSKQMQMVLYHSEDGTVSVNAYIKDEDLWITQKAMAELFGVDKSGISRHLKNIFNTGELDEGVVVAKIATTTQHGAMDGKTQTSETKYYNLDAIISVGYRVNSKKATQFRIWATQILKEYMKKGTCIRRCGFGRNICKDGDGDEGVEADGGYCGFDSGGV